MIIAIEYKNGRMKEFDTSAFTATNAMSAGDKTARNVMTELDLRLDLVNEVGLRLDFYWYDATPQGQRVDIPGLIVRKGTPSASPLHRGAWGPPCFSAPEKASNRFPASSYSVRTGRWMPFGGRVRAIGSSTGRGSRAQRVLSYTDSNVTSMNSQAVFVFKYMKKANPLMSEEEICDLIGYPLDAYKEIQLDEAKNAEGIVGAELIESDDGEDSEYPSDSAAPNPSDSPANSSLGKHFAVDDDDDGFDDDEDSLFDV